MNRRAFEIYRDYSLNEHDDMMSTNSLFSAYPPVREMTNEVMRPFLESRELDYLKAMIDCVVHENQAHSIQEWNILFKDVLGKNNPTALREN